MADGQSTRAVVFLRVTFNKKYSSCIGVKIVIITPMDRKFSDKHDGVI